MTEVVVPPDAKVGQMKKLIELRDRKDDLKRELSDVEEDIKKTENGVLEWFESSGIQSVSVENRTLFLRRQLWARGRKDIDPEVVIEALRENDLGDLVKETFSVQSLSAHVRELDKEGEALPAPLADVLSVSEQVNVSVRRKS